MTTSKSVVRRLEFLIYGRMLGLMPSAAEVEPCFKCGRDTRVREPRRLCGPCIMESRRGAGGGSSI